MIKLRKCIIKMKTITQSEIKSKTANFENLSFKVNQKLNNLKLVLDFKFYQNLFLVFLALSIFLIFPESPKDSEN